MGIAGSTSKMFFLFLLEPVWGALVVASLSVETQGIREYGVELCWLCNSSNDCRGVTSGYLRFPGRADVKQLGFFWEINSMGCGR